MRAALFLVPLLFLAPVVGANSETGSATGAYLCAVNGAQQAGVGMAYFVANDAGVPVTDTLALSWIHPPLLVSDYDLELWTSTGSEGTVTLGTEVAASEHHGSFAPANESITFTFPAHSVYIALVVPFQTKGEPFTLTSGATTLSGGIVYDDVSAASPTPELQLYEGFCPV